MSSLRSATICRLQVSQYEYDWLRCDLSNNVTYTGSGFLWRYDRAGDTAEIYVVTAYHVIENCRSIAIQLLSNDGRTVDIDSSQCKILGGVPLIDVGVVSATIPAALATEFCFASGSQAIPRAAEDDPLLRHLASVRLSSRQAVVTIGFPLSSMTLQFTTGIIMGLAGNSQGNLKITAPVNAGVSGGPMVLQERGTGNLAQIVGIVVAKSTYAENTNFAVHARALHSCLLALLRRADTVPVFLHPPCFGIQGEVPTPIPGSAGLLISSVKPWLMITRVGGAKQPVPPRELVGKSLVRVSLPLGAESHQEGLQAVSTIGTVKTDWWLGDVVNGEADAQPTEGVTISTQMTLLTHVLNSKKASYATIEVADPLKPQSKPAQFRVKLVSNRDRFRTYYADMRHMPHESPAYFRFCGVTFCELNRNVLQSISSKADNVCDLLSCVSTSFGRARSVMIVAAFDSGSDLALLRTLGLEGQRPPTPSVLASNLSVGTRVLKIDGDDVVHAQNFEQAMEKHKSAKISRGCVPIILYPDTLIYVQIEGAVEGANDVHCSNCTSA